MRRQLAHGRLRVAMGAATSGTKHGFGKWISVISIWIDLFDREALKAASIQRSVRQAENEASKPPRIDLTGLRHPAPKQHPFDRSAGVLTGREISKSLMKMPSHARI